MATTRFGHKNSTGELFFPRYFVREGGSRPVQKGGPNGLESTKNRRSAGWHGNQHVCLRCPQVIGGRYLHVLTQVDLSTRHVPGLRGVSELESTFAVSGLTYRLCKSDGQFGLPKLG